MFSYLRQPGGFYRRLFLLALPIIVQNLITTSLGFLDTFMVGLLGSEQMSAVTVANVPIFIIQLIVFGLQSGSSVLISQYWGRGDRESINRVIGIGLCIAGSVSTLFALIMAFFPADVLLLVTDNLRLVAIGTPYIRIVGFSYILNSLSSIYIGMQRSIENPRFGMLVFGASMLCNTVGNYVLIFGKLGGKDIMAMQGRFHYYEGYSMKDVTFPIRVMYELGIKTLFVSNASGGMNPEFKIGDLMIITDHINFFPEHPLRGKNFPTGPRFPDMHETYDHALIKEADQIAEEKGIRVMHGVYVGVQGPTFETPAEYKMYHRLGGDAVGMSTVPEVIVAHHCGIRTFGISIITDLGLEDTPVEVSHEEVQVAANNAQPLMTEIMREMIRRA